ncbi:hypothetical protein NFI96_026904, partial [Prochilodus magdalenae]
MLHSQRAPHSTCLGCYRLVVKLGFISGLVLFCLGAWIKFGAASFIEVMGSFSGQLLTSIYINMGVGSALCLLGLLGCCGACTHNRCLILLYFAILSVMFIGQMVCTILVLLYKDVVTSMIQAASKESLMTMYMGPAATDPISKAWNSIMTKYKCCGFENSTHDFRRSIFATDTGLLYPKTCCVDMKSPACDGLDTTPSLIHQK